MKVNIVLADPPWRFETYSELGKGKSPERHYPTLTLERLMNLPVTDIAANDCALFMWSIDPLLPQAIMVGEAWGFTYKTVAFIWTKTTKRDKWHFGTGYWTRANPEMCLLFTKGKPQRLARNVRR